MILLILLLGLILRIIALNQSLWLDEAINVVNAENLDLFSFLIKYPVGDFHPPLYFFVIWVWGRLFNFSEMVIRFPSIIFGLGTIFTTYLFAKDLFNEQGSFSNKKVGLLSVLLLTLSPLHVYYSQEARMYSLAAFGAILSFYFLNKVFKGDKYSGIFYIISTAMILYSDYVACFVIPAQLFFIVFWKKEFFNNGTSKWVYGPQTPVIL